MKHRRLQHAADTLCHMFCGWRLINCYAALEGLGSGELQINALSRECTFNGNPIEPLSIAFELNGWLEDDVKANHIDISGLKAATLKATLSLSKISPNMRKTTDQHFDKDKHAISKGTFNRLEIDCSSSIETDEMAYTSNYQDLEEWPLNWPAT
jgi:hypothetical protein